MWQLYALGALVSNSIENIIDKVAVIREESLDPFVATFCRVTLYVGIMTLIGSVGLLGDVRFFFSKTIIALGLFGALYSLSYTYALKKIEITNIGIISYLGPFLFLIIDTFILKTHLSYFQIGGFTLLMLGGLGFSIEGKSLNLKKELSPLIWVFFLFWLAYWGVEAYAFKEINITEGISGASFFVSVWCISAFCLLMIVMFQRKLRLIFSMKTARFSAHSSISKTFDAVSTILGAQALIYASVSQASAMELMSPLILFILTLITQGIFRLSINEKIDRSSILLKSISIIFLIIGGLLIR